MLPGCAVVHIPDELPAAPEEHPGFWELWLPVIRRAVPDGIDAVFTSEYYGPELARRLDAVHMIADRGRDGVPVSGTAVRADPTPTGATSLRRCGRGTAGGWWSSDRRAPARRR
jgi:hypothetical protein